MSMREKQNFVNPRDSGTFPSPNPLLEKLIRKIQKEKYNKMSKASVVRRQSSVYAWLDVVLRTEIQRRFVKCSGAARS